MFTPPLGGRVTNLSLQRPEVRMVPSLPKSCETGALTEQREGGSHDHSFGDESPPNSKNHGILEHLETVVVHSVGRITAKTKV